MRYINLRFTYLLTYQTCKTTSSLHSYRGNTRTRNFYQKLAPMHVTKIVRFDWSAVFDKFLVPETCTEQICVLFGAGFWKKFPERVSPILRYAQKTCTRKDAFYRAHQKKWMKTDPYYQRQNLSLASRNARYMRISAGVLRGRGVKRQWGCRRRQFSAFSVAICSETLDRISIKYIYRIYSPSTAFQWPPNAWPWMTLNSYFTLNSGWLFHVKLVAGKRIFLFTYTSLLL